MISTLFQITTVELESKERISIYDDIVNKEGGDLDTRAIDDAHRQECIEALVNELLPNGMFTLLSGDRLRYNGGYKEWAAQWADMIHEKAAAVTGENITDWIGPRYQLEKAIANPLDIGSLFMPYIFSYCPVAEQSGYFMTEFVAELKEGDVVYIGGVLKFHS